MEILNWFMTGPNGPYMTLVHCMSQDWFWIGLMVLANSFVILGYLEFARRNYKAYKKQKGSEVADAYMGLIWVFIFCALCGYTYPIIAILYPIKKAFVLVTFALGFVTWNMIFKANSIDFYNEIFKKKD